MDATDQLDALIERRSRGVDPDEREELWMESVRKYRARHREAALRQRLEWHEEQLVRHTRTFEELLRRHRVGIRLVEEALGIAGKKGGSSVKRAEKPDVFTARERSAIRKALLATLPGDEPVTLARPGGEKDVTLFTAAGPIRFLEGRARVPLAVARELAGPGWSIEGAKLS